MMGILDSKIIIITGGSGTYTYLWDDNNTQTPLPLISIEFE